MEYGRRLIYGKNTGIILNNCLGKMCGDLDERLRPVEIDYIDLPYNYNDNNFEDAIEYHINVTKDKNTNEIKDIIVIDRYIEHIETDEEKLRREKEELENQLLLAENNNIDGGIL